MSNAPGNSDSDAGFHPRHGKPMQIGPTQPTEGITSITSGTVAAVQSTNVETNLMPAGSPPGEIVTSITAPSSASIGAGQPGQTSSPQTQQLEETSVSPLTSTSTPIPTAPVSAGAVSSPSSGSSLSNGAVAGVAIGTLIVGAALAFVAAFFIFKRRNKSRDGHGGAAGYAPYGDSSPELIMLQKGMGGSSPYVQVSQTPLSAPIPVHAPAPVRDTNPPDIITDILPAAAHETEVQSRISALFHQIHRHVETYYRDVHATLTPSMEPELAMFGAQGVNMAELLQDCSNPTTAIKHALMVYVLSITGPKKREEGETIFPEELQGGQLQRIAGSDPKLKTASTLHRRLSVYLFAATSSLSNPRRSRHAQSDVREAAEHFSLTFFPWANPAGDDHDKDADLARIISEGLETRIWLFGQPCMHEFRWDGVGQRGIVISPELVRRSDEDGERNGRLVLESGIAGM